MILLCNSRCTVSTCQKILWFALDTGGSTLWSGLGMATGRVRAGFFHIRTRPAGQDPQPRPGPFTKRIFFPGPGPAPAGPRGLHGPRWAVVLQGPFCGPIEKKKKSLPNIDFLGNQTGGEKNTQENLLFSQQPTDRKTLFFFFHYNILPNQKQKQDRSEQ